MKKLLALLMVLTMTFSLVACGGKETVAEETTAVDVLFDESDIPQDTEAASVEETSDAETKVVEDDAEVSDTGLSYKDTKTGKYFSQFEGKELYMDMEVRSAETGVMSMIIATDGENSYVNSTIVGMGSSEMISTKDTLYMLDRQNKIAYQSAVQSDAEATTSSTTVIKEDDVDMTDYKVGTYTIDNTTYDTEEWVIDGANCIVCFDGDDVVYMITTDGQVEVFMKFNSISTEVDASLFEIPDGFQIVNMADAMAQ